MLRITLPWKASAAPAPQVASIRSPFEDLFLHPALPDVVEDDSTAAWDLWDAACKEMEAAPGLLN